MPIIFNVYLNTTRNILRGLPLDRRLPEARRNVKMFLVPREQGHPMSDADVPDYLVTDDMVERYLALSPPVASVIPEFQTVIIEIEHSYVLGLFFSALSASCAAIERLLNLARIELHRHHTKIKSLWNKGASNSWEENIDALQKWDYLDDSFALELNKIYRDIRCRYLHSAPISEMSADAFRVASAAHKLLGMFLGFPENLFRFTSQGFECMNTSDPRYVAFYVPHARTEPHSDG